MIVIVFAIALSRSQGQALETKRRGVSREFQPVGQTRNTLSIHMESLSAEKSVNAHRGPSSADATHLVPCVRSVRSQVTPQERQACEYPRWKMSPAVEE